MKKFSVFVLCIFTFFSANSADINIDVDGFVGAYYIDSSVGYANNQTFNLAPGSHTLTLSAGGSVNFTVNMDGTVTSGDLLVMTGSGSTLQFNNADIYFDVGLYELYYMIGPYGFRTGSQTFRIPRGISVPIVLPHGYIVSTFSVDASDDVTVLTGTDAIDGSNGSLSFNTIPIILDPQFFNGYYLLFYSGWQQGPTEHQVFPNSQYLITNYAGVSLGTVNTDSDGFASSSSTSLKTDGNTLNFHQNRYIVTPPSGYTGPWAFHGDVNNYGIDDVWLIRGGGGLFFVIGGAYDYIASDDCTTFTISTPHGTFTAVCDNDSALYYDPLAESGFNDFTKGFTVRRYDGRLSTDSSDYDLTVNGKSFDLSGMTLNGDQLPLANALIQGRNALILNGKDEDGNTFHISKTFWAGRAEITAITDGPTDTVTLTAEQFVGGKYYSFSLVQEAVGHQTTFINVPQMADGVVTISTSRNKEVFRKKLSRSSVIHL